MKNLLSQLEEIEIKFKELQEDSELFGSVLSHDIRTPIRNMVEYCNQLTLLHRNSKDTETKHLISLLKNEIERSQGSLSCLLEYTRIGNSNLKPKNIRTNDILNNILTNHADAINQSKAMITHDHLPDVTGNRVYISHLFSHIIENALKFRKPTEPPIIHIGSRIHEGMVEFTIHDNGIGISEEFHSIVFVLFQRLHSEEEIAGKGAGLALCKKMVELHGGKIWLDSIPNKGTTIHFTLPVAEEERNLVSNTIVTHAPSSTPSHNIETIQDDTIHVLLVEDMKSDADALQQVLAHNNLNSDLHIVAETKLESGLEYIAHHKTDVVFLDLGLPDMKGIQVIDKVHQAYPHLPIIVFSGNSDKELITEALQHGAKQFLVKGECSGLMLKNSIYQAIA